MAYEVVRSADADRDLGLIFDFLVGAAEAFGDDPEAAFDRAAGRLEAMLDAMEALGRAPHQGSLDPLLGDGIGHVTKGRAIFYFDLDEAAERLRVLAVFHGGQDHRRHMLLRLRSDLV